MEHHSFADFATETLFLTAVGSRSVDVNPAGVGAVAQLEGRSPVQGPGCSLTQGGERRPLSGPSLALRELGLFSAKPQVELPPHPSASV